MRMPSSAAILEGASGRGCARKALENRGALTASKDGLDAGFITLLHSNLCPVRYDPQAGAAQIIIPNAWDSPNE